MNTSCMLKPVCICKISLLQYIFAATVYICIVGDAGGCRGAKAEVGMKQTDSATL